MTNNFLRSPCCVREQGRMPAGCNDRGVAAQRAVRPYRLARFVLVAAPLVMGCEEDGGPHPAEGKTPPAGVVSNGAADVAIRVYSHPDSQPVRLKDAVLTLELAWGDVPDGSLFQVHLVDPGGDAAYRLQGRVTPGVPTVVRLPLGGGGVGGARQVGWWAVEARLNWSLEPVGRLDFEIVE